MDMRLRYGPYTQKVQTNTHTHIPSLIRVKILSLISSFIQPCWSQVLPKKKYNKIRRKNIKVPKVLVELEWSNFMEEALLVVKLTPTMNLCACVYLLCMYIYIYIYIYVHISLTMNRSLKQIYYIYIYIHTHIYACITLWTYGYLNEWISHKEWKSWDGTTSRMGDSKWACHPTKCW